MREVISTVATAVVALLVIGAAVFGGGDRSIFVPVPETTAESFAHDIATRRYDLALNFLAAGTRRGETAERLRARFEPVLAVGKVNGVDSEPQWTNQDRASARARIAGSRGTASFDLGFVRENGLWKIDRLPDLVR